MIHYRSRNKNTERATFSVNNCILVVFNDKKKGIKRMSFFQTYVVVVSLETIIKKWYQQQRFVGIHFSFE